METRYFINLHYFIFEKNDWFEKNFYSKITIVFMDNKLKKKISFKFYTNLKKLYSNSFLKNWWKLRCVEWHQRYSRRDNEKSWNGANINERYVNTENLVCKKEKGKKIYLITRKFDSFHFLSRQFIRVKSILLIFFIPFLE